MKKIVVVLLMGVAILSCNDTQLNKEIFNTDDIRKSILSSIEIYRYATRLDYVAGQNERAANRLSVEDFELSIIEAGVEKYGQVFQDDFKSVKEADVTKRLYSTVEVVKRNNSRSNQVIDTTYPEQFIANYFAIVQPTNIV